MNKNAFDREKFDNLVHYVIASCPDPAKLGSTKLHKILWKSDTGIYKLEGRSITGATYVKRQFGPATNELLASRERLAKAHAIRFWRDGGFTNRRAKDVYQNKTPANASFLSKQEKQTVDYWIREICLNHTAETISEETHGYAWEIAKLGEPLPLCSVFVDELPEEPDEEGQAWALSEARRLGFCAV